MSSPAPQLSPHSLDQGLGDWLSGPTCDDILYGGANDLDRDDLAGSWSFDTFSDGPTLLPDSPANERQAIFEEMQAVGLHRPGGYMRQAFSLSDLTVLQPPVDSQASMATTWSPSGNDAQLAFWGQAEAPELFGSPMHGRHQTLYDPSAAALQHLPGTPMPSSSAPVPDALGFCGTALGVPSTPVHDAALGCIPENDLLQPGSAAPTGQGIRHAAASSRYHFQDASTTSPGRDLRPSKMRRSQSALELSSMTASFSRPAEAQQHAMQKQVGVELTTPEGHTYRAGRLAPEERLQKILKYRQKRHERNFTKRIKYQCRKTLADSRPRVRGRFARNDDSSAVMPRSSEGRKRTS